LAGATQALVLVKLFTCFEAGGICNFTVNIEPKGHPIYTHTLGLESIQEFYPVKLKLRHPKYMKTAPQEYTNYI
jgi:hypothetical protein